MKRGDLLQPADEVAGAEQRGRGAASVMLLILEPGDVAAERAGVVDVGEAAQGAASAAVEPSERTDSATADTASYLNIVVFSTVDAAQRRCRRASGRKLVGPLP